MNDFREDGVTVTGFSIVDYKNYKVGKQIGDTIQPNAHYNKIIPIQVNFFYSIYPKINIIIAFIQFN